MREIRFSLLMLCSLWNSFLFSQAVKTSNVHHRVIENRIEIFYDLAKNSDSVNVSLLFYKKSNPNFKFKPHYVFGDTGTGIFSGSGKKITWYYKKEPTSVFVGSGFYFKVRVHKLNE